ncbi:hypothetical protein HRbin01_01242 [archaeon HR01]|nr:hypothetical protein HRbin01_01242 [archaeon HR01]
MMVEETWLTTVNEWLSEIRIEIHGIVDIVALIDAVAYIVEDTFQEAGIEYEPLKTTLHENRSKTILPPFNIDGKPSLYGTNTQ